MNIFLSQIILQIIYNLVSIIQSVRYVNCFTIKIRSRVNSFSFSVIIRSATCDRF
jgi:hypothetical protein